MGKCSLALLLGATTSGALHVATPQLPARLARPFAPRTSPLALQEVGEDASPTASTPTTPDGEVDLAEMTFEERLEYLAARVPDTPAPKEEDETSMFGIDMSNSDTTWWSFPFWKLCFEDLGTLQWPTRKQTVQTVVVSQIAFVAILVFILLFDATVEAGMRSLLQGADFSCAAATTPHAGSPTLVRLTLLLPCHVQGHGRCNPQEGSRAEVGNTRRSTFLNLREVPQACHT